MNRKLKTLIIAAAISGLGITSAYAFSSWTVGAAENSGQVGYTFSPPFGTVSGSLNGKAIFKDIELYGGASPVFILSVRGFTSNPGAAFFASMNHQCSTGGMTLTSASATYSYDSSLGVATWEWTLPKHCMLQLPGSHSYTVTAS